MCVVVCRFVRVFAGFVVLFLCGLFGLRASLGFVRGCVWSCPRGSVCGFVFGGFVRFFLPGVLVLCVVVFVLVVWFGLWSCGVVVGFGVLLFAVFCVVFMVCAGANEDTGLFLLLQLSVGSGLKEWKSCRSQKC